MDPKLSLSWDSHQKSICNGLSLLQQRGEFVDMTLAADGHHVKVHQMVMSLVSPYIKGLISTIQCPHPVVFLNRVSYQTLQLILEYAYTGEVMLPRDDLHEFLEACRVLHIRGLEDESIKTSADRAMLRRTGNDARTQPPHIEHTAVGTLVEASASVSATEQRTMKFEQQIDSDNQNNPNVDNTVEFTMEDTQHSGADDTLDEFEAETLDESSKKPSDEVYAAIKKKQKQSGTTMQYSLSCQGSIQIILNRYLYRLRYSRKNERKLWRCADYNKKRCQAYVITKGDIVLERGCAHSHPFHDRQILKRLQHGNVYSHFTAAENIAAVTHAHPGAGAGKPGPAGDDKEDSEDDWPGDRQE